jgi:predicted LPLAT superfamily acyltransferase
VALIKTGPVCDARVVVARAGARGTFIADSSLDDADVLLFLADAQDPVEAAAVASTAAAARRSGILVASLIVLGAHPSADADLLAALRDASEMIMVVREPRSVAEILAALR